MKNKSGAQQLSLDFAAEDDSFKLDQEESSFKMPQVVEAGDDSAKMSDYDFMLNADRNDDEDNSESYKFGQGGETPRSAADDGVDIDLAAMEEAEEAKHDDQLDDDEDEEHKDKDSNSTQSFEVLDSNIIQ